ncbi:CAP domain-containing protein, partial [Streptomyces alkaliterrae]
TRPSPSSPPPAPPRPAPQPSAGQPGGSAAQVLALVNSERGKNGCSPVRSNSLLQTAAQRHSQDMANRDYFDHTNPDGAGPSDRITAVGYQWSRTGENIAMGQRTPADVMNAWMNSPGHRANILNCAFTELGVGIHDAPGGIRWTQKFATPR